MGDLHALLNSYPRQRKPLGQRHADLFVNEYQRNRSGGNGLSAIVASLESWMHKRVSGGKSGERLLEIGAGTLNHVPYETGVSVYDVIEPFRELWQSSPNLSKVTQVYEDVSLIPAGARYDRIISVAVLEHLTDLPRTVAQCALLLDTNGELRAGIPTEGGFSWGLAWRTTTGVSFRLRTGLDYGVIMRHEHVNSADEILAVMRYLFRQVKLDRFPLPAKHLSFYTVLTAAEPDLERCRQWAR